MAKSTSEIKRYIASVADGNLFSTAQILAKIPSVHSRASIDKALARMVANGTLKRITYGLFAVAEKQDKDCSMFEIAKTKYNNPRKPLLYSSFKGKYDAKEAPNGNLNANNDTVFFSLGKSTKFRYKDDYISIKQLSAKKLQLASSEIGTTVLNLWQKGKHLTDAAEITKIIAPLSRKQLEEFIALAPCMPNWLSTRAKEVMGPKWQKIERELQQRNPAKIAKAAVDRGR